MDMHNSALDASSAAGEADAAAVRIAEDVLSAAAELTAVDPAELSPETLLKYTGLLGNIGRLIEGRQVLNVGDIARRSDTDAGMEGLAARHGSASPTALFEKITGVKNSTAYRYTSVAKHTAPRVSDTGLPLPAVFEQTSEALSEGTIGLDAAEALTSTLATVLPRAVPEHVDEAEALLLGNATGAFGKVPVAADNLRLQAKAFCTALDPDGVEPTDEELHQSRRLNLRSRPDGTMSISGVLSPHQAAIITPVFDAYMSSRTGPGFVDTEELRDRGKEEEKRSRAQERADVFTSMIGGVGKLESTPKLHGRGPTVLVTVRDEDLRAGTGAAWSPGTPEPLPMAFVRQAQCDGDTVEVTLDGNGRVTKIGTPQRLFTPQQRLALIARDGPTCIVDDCSIPAWLCEAHHVDGWANGGRTDVSNGVLVCWFHHRLIERGEWTIIADGKGSPRVVPPHWYVNRKYLGRRRPPESGRDI